MKLSAVIRQLDEDKGVVDIIGQSDRMEIPLKYLPEESRVGDVLQISIHFDPFETLEKE